MQKSIYILALWVLTLSVACENSNTSTSKSHSTLDSLFNSYWEQRLKLYPLEATAVGDSRYNDLLPISISDSYRDTLRQFYTDYLAKSKAISSSSLNEEDLVSKELFDYELNLNLQALSYPSHLAPINQFWSFTLEFPQLGSGTGNQPFKTVKDYQDFLARMQKFPAWVDTAIANMRRGMSSNYVLPKALAKKMIPQLQGIWTADVTKNLFYQSVLNMPSSLSSEEKKKIQESYAYEIGKSIIPSYTKLKNFIEQDYLPACRETSGISSLPGGKEYYQFLIKNYTTTNLSPDSIYQLGLNEVARLTSEMEKVMKEVQFTGTLPEFFEFINKEAQFYPFKTPQAVLDSFWAIKKWSEPKLKSLFEGEPKTKFEIRQTEAFRAASASAEYNAGSEDGSRPGIFYVPILDPTKFNIVGMETLFLHEAIPGHHYQISLQQENKDLPKFRKFLGYSAYAEGWALYTETLGRDLGLFQNPYQYLGHLSDAMHRAIRLVVDVAIHTKGMTREEAIAYMRAHERISEEEATAEIERYMAIPGQALSYKIGQITISEMRKDCEKSLGLKFNIAQFHTQLLNGGNMPLEVLQKKLERWKMSF